ncbi:MAG: ABC transporter substrate-binding protein [Chloroflexi bacterium]|nr:ABC transporter substrate-binding protein [Chloroflexota bacterium]
MKRGWTRVLRSRTYRLHLWLLVVVIASSVSLVGCGGAKGPGAAAGPTKVRVALDWYPNSDHAGLYVALERGYFKAAGLEVELYTPANPSDVLKTVGAGRDDFGISYQPEVILARAQGIPVKSIAAIVQYPLDSILTLKSSGITSPAQLRGKRVGYPGLPLDEALITVLLEKDGLTLKDVELVNVGYDLVPSLIGRRVDAVIGAYWTHESILAEMQGHPVNVLRLEQLGIPRFYELVLVTRDAMVTGRAEVVERFVKAVVQGYMEAAKDPAEAFNVLAKRNPEINKDMERQAIELLAPLFYKEGEIPIFGWQTLERWDGFMRWMKGVQLLEREIDPREAFTNEFVEKAAKSGM